MMISPGTPRIHSSRGTIRSLLSVATVARRRSQGWVADRGAHANGLTEGSKRHINPRGLALQRGAWAAPAWADPAAQGKGTGPGIPSSVPIVTNVKPRLR